MRSKRNVKLPKAKVLGVRRPTYPPSKVEMEERHKTAASALELAKALLKPTKIVYGAVG